MASLSPATSSHLTPGVESRTSLSSMAAKSPSGPSYCAFLDLPSSASLLAESALLELDFPFLPPVLEAVDDLTAGLALLPLGFAPRLGVPVFDGPRAQAPSWEDFLALDWPLADLRFGVFVSLGGAHTSGSSKVVGDDVGYSSNGWNRNDLLLERIGGDEDRIVPGASLNDFNWASSCLTISTSSLIALLQFIHFVRLKLSSKLARCLLICAMAPSKKMMEVS